MSIPCGKYVIIARSFSFSVAVKNLACLYLSSNFSSKCRMILLVFYFMLYPSTRKLSLWVISARVQTKVSVAVSLFYNILLRLGPGYSFVVFNHHFAIVFFFILGAKTKGWGDSIKYFLLYILKFTVKKCKNVVMLWIPHASDNRASMFKSTKNFLSSKATLNGWIIESADEEK